MKWMYPTYHFVAAGPKPVAELWDDRAGVRLALVARADTWPEGSYVIRIPTPTGMDRWPDDKAVQMQGDFLEAQKLAVALARLS